MGVGSNGFGWHREEGLKWAREEAVVAVRSFTRLTKGHASERKTHQFTLQ